MGKGIHAQGLKHPRGLLWRLYRWLRGSEQVLVRPARELPLVLISYAKGDWEGMERLKESLEETWLTLPNTFRNRYAEILRTTPPFVVVVLRRRNLCACLGHHHPPGTESRITRRLRGLSGVPTGELKQAGKTTKRGTKVTFAPDPTIFDTTEFNFDTLSHFVAEQFGVQYGLRHSAE